MNVVRCVAIGAFLALAACGKTDPPPSTGGGSAGSGGSGNPETPPRTPIPQADREYATLPSGTYRAYCLRLKATDGKWYGRAKVLGIDPQLIANRAEPSSRAGWPTEVDVPLETGSSVMETLALETSKARRVAAQAAGRPADPEPTAASTILHTCENLNLIQQSDVLGIGNSGNGLELRLTRAGETKRYPLSPPTGLADGQFPMWYETARSATQPQYFVYMEDAIAAPPAIRLQRYRIEAFAAGASEECRTEIPALNSESLVEITPQTPCEISIGQQNGVGAGNEPR